MQESSHYNLSDREIEILELTDNELSELEVHFIFGVNNDISKKGLIVQYSRNIDAIYYFFTNSRENPDAPTNVIVNLTPGIREYVTKHYNNKAMDGYMIEKSHLSSIAYINYPYAGAIITLFNLMIVKIVEDLNSSETEPAVVSDLYPIFSRLNLQYPCRLENFNVFLDNFLSKCSDQVFRYLNNIMKFVLENELPFEHLCRIYTYLSPARYFCNVYQEIKRTDFWKENEQHFRIFTNVYKNLSKHLKSENFDSEARTIITNRISEIQRWLIDFEGYRNKVDHVSSFSRPLLKLKYFFTGLLCKSIIINDRKYDGMSPDFWLKIQKRDIFGDDSNFIFDKSKFNKQEFCKFFENHIPEFNGFLNHLIEIETDRLSLSLPAKNFP